MAFPQHITGGTVLSIASGTLLTVLANISSGDLLKTAILAAVGAAASYIVTQLLQQFARLLKPRK